jgi:hypothetical protein
MPFVGGMLQHVEPRRDGAVAFHVDGSHPCFEAGLRVADAGEAGDEVRAILVLVEGLLARIRM